MSKKRIVIAIIAAIVVAAMLVTGYLTKTRDADEEPEPDSTHISAQDDSGVAGPVLDELPEDVWADDSETSYSGFTTRAQLGEVADSIGVLTIEKIGVSCNVFDSDESTVMEDMKRGAAHYKSTSYWDGNIGLSAHIGNLDYCYFDRLDELELGDIITYETNLGVRHYAVKTIAPIGDEEWSYLDRTPDNCITLTTCIDDQEEMRLCVQAVEVGH